MNRRRFKQTESLGERLRHQSKRIRLKSDSLPPGEERDQLLKKVRDVDMAARIQDWLRSPSLQPPK
ncbi:hypothetical protein [Bradyrhizobium sp. Arg816]|uniref:hypothetical protein n=1 Tax=Bradyrhizobium sp. Arg816 TaxID=2998491 RepID=UPI00249EE6DC|nr:hypothetical protein [Bradyrhizobium sp. Arg816]MDI3562507.1 hypothetical protein [Bradyrhizobium sp. Arg816]